MDLCNSFNEEELLVEVTRLARKYVMFCLKTEDDDLVQEVVLKFLKRVRTSGHIESDVTLEIMVSCVVRNGVRDRLRQGGRRERREAEFGGMQEDAMPEWMSPEDSFDEAEYAELYRSVVEELPVRTREVFLAMGEREATYAKVADAFDITEQDVRTSMAFVRRRFRAALRRVGIDEERTIKRRRIA